MARLPVVGGDNGAWGQILNEYLGVEHNADGSLKLRTDGTLSAADVNAVATSQLGAPSGVATLDGSSKLTIAQIPNGVITESINSVGSAGASQTLPDVTAATVHRLVLNANCTLTFPAAATGKTFTLVLVQDGVGSRTVTWPGSILWASGIIPTLTTTANKQDMFSFICVDGTNWMGLIVGQGF